MTNVTLAIEEDTLKKVRKLAVERNTTLTAIKTIVRDAAIKLEAVQKEAIKAMKILEINNGKAKQVLDLIDEIELGKEKLF